MDARASRGLLYRLHNATMVRMVLFPLFLLTVAVVAALPLGVEDRPGFRES